MSTSSTRIRAEQSEFVCKRTDDDSGGEEVTFFEPDREPDERTTRWITVRASDCVPEGEWR